MWKDEIALGAEPRHNYWGAVWACLWNSGQQELSVMGSAPLPLTLSSCKQGSNSGPTEMHKSCGNWVKDSWGNSDKAQEPFPCSFCPQMADAGFLNNGGTNWELFSLNSCWEGRVVPGLMERSSQIYTFQNFSHEVNFYRKEVFFFFF